MPAEMEMSSAAGLSLSDSHPLSEELRSLRALVTRFQNEAHASSIKLQRHALDTSTLSERLAQLEAENRALTTELQVLRDNPLPSTEGGTGTSQETVAELTLSLRRLNAKLTLTESALAEHTSLLAHERAASTQHAHAAGEAYALAARARAREEEGLQRERALERSLLGAREEARLSDRVVGEYAALVRTLEGRSPPGSAKGWTDGARAGAGGSSATLVDPIPPSSPTPASSLTHSKSQLAALTDRFASQTTALSARAAALQTELDIAQAQLAAARTLTAELGAEVGRAKFAAEKARVDDRSAAGMVERYMKFTQQTTTALHTSLTSLRARHSATILSLTSSLSSSHSSLAASRQSEERLRNMLDEAGRREVGESVGRRREVGVRVRMVGREGRVVGGLRGAVLNVVRLVGDGVGGEGMGGGGARGGEVGEREGDGEGEGEAKKALAALVRDVRRVLAMLDSDVELPIPMSSDAPDAHAHAHANARANSNKEYGSAEKDRGTEGRMLLLESAVEMLVAELEGEVKRRVEAERVLGERERLVLGERDEDADADGDGKAGSALPHAHPAVSDDDELETNGREHGPEQEQGHVHQPSPRLPPDGRLLAGDYPFAGDEEENEGGEEEEENKEGEGGEGAREQEVEQEQEPEQEQERTPELTAHQDLEEAPTSAPAPVHAAPAQAVPFVQPSPGSVAIVFPSMDPADAPPPSAPEPPLRAPTPPAPAPALAPPAPPPPPTHPLLADLAAASKRYDALQRAFRDCHLALEELRAVLLRAPDNALAHVPSDANANASYANANALPRVNGNGHGTALDARVLRGAVERLHDYTEDARVELEIRVADGRVLARGWETLVGMPASSSASSADGGGGRTHEHGDGDGAAEVRRQIAEFVQRDAQAQAAFARKLEDVEHDIGAVKRVVYAPPSEEGSFVPLEPMFPVTPDADAERENDGGGGGGARGWASWLRSGTPSPAYADAPPTFGSVMTSPRLRHSASAARLGRRDQQQQRNPFEGLGLRVAMPAYVSQPQQQQQQQAQAQEEARVVPRQRTISGVYMLGLGVGHPHGGRRPSGLGLAPRVDGSGKADGGVDADVE
ncbi:hypothetical protein B0H11DRAFT_2429684 [Mycena galericulata]|nr:hypothetical protein B0H11DRAFT_2429684 [Mycena galericulata]